jgi:hypothetical protein
MKIQIKIALLFTLVCTLIIIAVSSAVYYFANEKAFQDFYTRLELRATIAAKANLDTNNVSTSAYEQVRNEHLQRLPDEREYILRIDSLQNEVKTGLNAEVPRSFFTILSSKKTRLTARTTGFIKAFITKTAQVIMPLLFLQNMLMHETFY